MPMHTCPLCHRSDETIGAAGCPMVAGCARGARLHAADVRATVAAVQVDAGQLRRAALLLSDPAWQAGAPAVVEPVAAPVVRREDFPVNPATRAAAEKIARMGGLRRKDEYGQLTEPLRPMVKDPLDP